MELGKVIESVNYLNHKKTELIADLDDIKKVLDNKIESKRIVDQQKYLQSLMNEVVEVRRTINSLNQKIPDIQENIREMLQELEDEKSLEE